MIDKSMIGKRAETTGEEPKNPIIRDVVYLISDIREEPAIPNPSDEGGEPPKRYSYLIDDVLELSEYLEKVTVEKEEYEAATDEAILEIDAMVCENADRIDALEQGAA